MRRACFRLVAQQEEESGWAFCRRGVILASLLHRLLYPVRGRSLIEHLVLDHLLGQYRDRFLIEGA
jgi:hypothetical protein